jgi:diguanylate cyclase (GGDEF)-like protein/PAS domain S-box-containing protein
MVTTPYVRLARRVSPVVERVTGVLAPNPGYAWLCAVAAVATAILGVWLVTGFGGPRVSQTISNVALFVAALTAAWACLHRGRRTNGRIRWAWSLVGLSVLSWGLGQIAWTWYESVLGDEVPFPSVADIGYLGLAPLTAAGLLILPVAAQTSANSARSVLDGLMIAASLLLVSWVGVLRPLLHAGADSMLALVISLAYPIGDIVVVTIALFMMARARRGGPAAMPLGLVGTGLVTFAVADSGFAYLTLVDAYASGAVIDLGWFAGFTLIMLAAYKPTSTAQTDTMVATVQRPLGVLLPYLAVVGALVASMFELVRTGQVETFVSWNRSVIIALIVGRQLLTLLENRSLTRHLEARVASRTAELKSSEQRFQALVQHSSDVVTVVDAGGVVRYQSESVTRVFGYTATELTGQPLDGILDGHSPTQLREALHQLSGHPYGNLTLELDVRHHDGRARQVEMMITNLMDDENVRGYVLNTRDISERKQLEAQLVHEAFHDTLTKLANRALFRDRVDQTLHRRHASEALIAVLFLDLDGFKEVNDSLGHASGDQLLIQVAERLRASVRVMDTVARFGGDEFAVLIEQSTSDDRDAVDVAKRIVDDLREPFLLEGQEMHVRASIGIATAGVHADDADQLMRNADLAMYRAKAAGDGGFAQYDPQMHSGLVDRLQMENDLRRALEHNELQLHYQPTIEMRTGTIIGFEALVRWNHPTRGSVSPTEFIPLAESTGMIRELGKWVLGQACRQAVEWGATTPYRALTMCVNVSGRQFEQADLPEIVAEVLADSNLSPQQLCLEMTESVLMNDTEENLALLVRLKEMGVRLAIDDFGTGYSSLSYLHRFPVDTIKIDRSFIERLNGQRDDSALARTIIQLGRSLGMAIVAEGIEHYSQFLALRRMGCDVGQGYYFSPPLPCPDATRLLEEAANTGGSPHPSGAPNQPSFAA